MSFKALVTFPRLDPRKKKLRKKFLSQIISAKLITSEKLFSLRLFVDLINSAFYHANKSKRRQKNSRANFLVYRLLEMLRIDNGTNFSSRI